LVNEVIQSALSIGLGVAGGGAFVSWLVRSYIAKVDKLIIAVTRLEATVRANESMKEDVKDHEKRITILEPKVKRAHERIDEHFTSKH
jgi:outer membrane murein-binding lipoprotein Lpp